LRFKILSFLIIGLLIRCQADFNSEKWKYSYDGAYPNRPKMIKTIIESDLIKEKNISEIEQVLGLPNNIDTTENGTVKLTFYVQESFGWNIDPLYTTNLILDLDNKTKKVKEIKFIESEDRRSWIEKLTTD
jgi:hypothetical protein